MTELHKRRDILGYNIMENPHFEFNDESTVKAKERFFIPSSVVSRICSPSPNFVEIPNFESYDLNFTTQSDLKSPDSRTVEKMFLNQEDDIRQRLVTEIETIKEELKVINFKLEQNLDSLKKSDEDQQACKFMKLIEKKRNHENERNEVYCSCTKQCSLF